ncbi:hypothetical protein IMG5_153310 [Ichthyophthirius multifiliis]|uniref:Uncharacterized protein n=1 Tax=Ichthyophthirius multifiliis TaxID=5932 RepID=G0QYY8_ICHMU|nr:hypothetical protein IMG5_153310 [Ichthyophthirius multifiliis]EGR29559.1 hypothetical protein IMG5_153310 [Ichthyophthirius multifiliis]|eukprot:XP_004030795.1 hypothetical protein IMG5_153310 [Ichthyophthirius multifiliis]
MPSTALMYNQIVEASDLITNPNDLTEKTIKGLFSSGASFIDIEFPLQILQTASPSFTSLYAQDLATGIKNGKPVPFEDKTGSLGTSTEKGSATFSQTTAGTIINLTFSSLNLAQIPKKEDELNQELIPGGSDMQISILIDNPTTTVTTGNFMLKFCLDSACLYEQQSINIIGISIIDIKELNLRLYQPQSTAFFCQSQDQCPLSFSFKFPDKLDKLVDYLVLENPSFMDTIISFDNTQSKELACFFQDFASYYCFYDSVQKTINIFAPSNTDILKDTILRIQIFSWRDTLYQTGTNLIQNFKLLPTYSFYKATPEKLQDIPISLQNAGGSILQVKKWWHFINQGFMNAYFCFYTTNINRDSLLKVYFQLSQPSNDALPDTKVWGMFELSLETMNEVGQTLIPYNLHSRFYKSNQEIDCLCQNNINLLFKCYVQYSGVSKESPTSIIIKPQQILAVNDILLLTFPKISMPLVENYYVRLQLRQITYDSIKKELIYLSDKPSDFVFLTTKYTTIQTNQLLDTSIDNKVGSPNNILWQLGNTNDLKKNTRDRIIIGTKTDEMIFEQPANPVSKTLKTTSDQGNVWIYTLAQWLEIEPTVNISGSSLQIRTIDFKNMPYEIQQGVYFTAETWSTGDSKLDTKYNKLDMADPHPFVQSDFQFENNLVGLVNKFTFTFQPFNNIPKSGIITAYWATGTPNPDNNWEFTNQYCKILSGLDDPDCQIIQDKLNNILQIQIKGQASNYNAAKDGPIKLQIQLRNSVDPGLRSNFKFSIYWDYYGYNNRVQVSGSNLSQRRRTCENLLYSSINLISVNPIQLTLLERYQNEIEICGGNIGPLLVTFQLNESLYYPHDYIIIDLYNMLIYDLTIPDPRIQEVICYFNNVSDPKKIKIKTFRCDFDQVNKRILAYVPEEMNLLYTNRYNLYMTIRTDNVDTWGFKISGPSKARWTRISTKRETGAPSATAAEKATYYDVGWVEALIPPCPFDNNQFSVYALTHEFNTLDYNSIIDANKNNNKYIYNLFNITLATTGNDIEVSDPSNPFRTRMVFEFLTHNGVFRSWDEDPTGNKLSQTGPAACGTLFNQYLGIATAGKQNSPKSFDSYSPGNIDIECTVYPSRGQSLEQPTYIVMENYEKIFAGNTFNINLGKIKNPNKPNHGTTYEYKVYDDTKRYQTSAHIRIHIEQRQVDGTYYHENTPISLSTATFKISHYDTRTNFPLRNVTYEINSLTSQLSNSRTAIVVQYSEPYELVSKGDCIQHNKDLPSVPHGPVACAFIKQSKWVVLSNNLVINPPEKYLVIEWEPTSRMNPPYTFDYIQKNSPLNAWVYSNKRVIMRRIQDLISPVQQKCLVLMETTAADNPQNREVTYRIGVYLQTLSSFMQTIELVAPKEFQNIRRCRIKKGLVLNNVNDLNDNIKCTIIYQTTWLIKITNFKFKNINDDGLLVLELLIMNPYISGWTNQWKCKTYAMDEQKIHDLNYQAEGSTWVGDFVPFPNLFRVYRNTVSFQDRRASTNDYAEVHMRIIPKKTHPQTDDSNKTQIEIWMPIEFDIPNGGQRVCEVTHKYHDDTSGQYCEITSDRKIFVNTNRYQGLMDKCGLVSATTINSINNQNGVKLPSVAGNNNFQVFITSEQNGKVTKEYSDLGATTKPQQLSTSSTGDQFNISVQEQETQEKQRVIIKFKSPIIIPPAYDTSANISDVNLNNPISYLDIQFNTRDDINNIFWTSSSGWTRVLGWPLNLGFTVTAGQKTFVPCKAYSGLIPKEGEKILCQLIPAQDYTIYTPAIVRVYNFQSVAKNQIIELHLLSILGQIHGGNAGYIDVGVFQQMGDGSLVWIIELTRFAIGGPSWKYYNQYRLYETDQIKITPNQVGAYSEWLFTFKSLQYKIPAIPVDVDCPEIRTALTSSIEFAAGTIFVLDIPKNYFELKDDGRIQATFSNIPMKIWVYEETNQIFLRIEQTVPCTGANELKITQLRNAAYQFLTPYSLKITSYRIDKQIKNTFRFNNISSPTPGEFVTLSLVLSKYFADERYVTYTFSFTPSYNIHLGSKITIELPNRADITYNGLGTSVPKELCVVSDQNLLDQSSCVMGPSLLTLLVKSNIAEQTPLSVQIIGTRNHPTFTGRTLSNDFSISIQTQSPYTIMPYFINQGNFPVITFLNKRETSFLYLTMFGTSYFNKVQSDYTFTIQSSSDLPIGGFIYLQFPNDFLTEYPSLNSIPPPTSIQGSWTVESLTYATIWQQAGANYLLKITPNFAWPSRGSLTFKFNSFKNPQITSITNPFACYTIYDNKKQDQTDINDNSLKFNFQPKPADLQVGAFSFTPQNEGSLSTYNFPLTLPSPPIGTTVTSQNPYYLDYIFDTTVYGQTLTTIDQTVPCKIKLKSQSNYADALCTVKNGVLSIPLTSDTYLGKEIDVQINNIVNPPAPTQIKSLLRQGSSIIQYTDNAASVNPKSPPSDLKMTLLETTSTALQAKASYTFCVTHLNQQAKTTQFTYIFHHNFPSKATINAKLLLSMKTAKQHMTSQIVKPNANKKEQPQKVKKIPKISAQMPTSVIKLMVSKTHQFPAILITLKSKYILLQKKSSNPKHQASQVIKHNSVTKGKAIKSQQDKYQTFLKVQLQTKFRFNSNFPFPTPQQHSQNSKTLNLYHLQSYSILLKEVKRNILKQSLQKMLKKVKIIYYGIKKNKTPQISSLKFPTLNSIYSRLLLKIPSKLSYRLQFREFLYQVLPYQQKLNQINLRISDQVFPTLQKKIKTTNQSSNLPQ